MNANMNAKGVKLLSVVAVMAMVVCAFAVIMPAEQTDAASTNDPTYIHGGITSFQDFGPETEVIIDGDLTIPANTGLKIAGKFTVNEGVTVTIQSGGFLIFDGDKAKVTINGSIVATGANTVDPETVMTPTTSGTEEGDAGDGAETQADEESVVYPSIVNTIVNNSNDNYFKVNGSVSIERGAVMSNNAASVDSNNDTSTIGKVVLSNGASLNVTKRSNDISLIANQSVVLNEGATFTLNAQVQNVKVQSTGTATYRTEATVALNATANDGYTDRTTSNLTFTVTNQAVSGCLYTYESTDYDKKYTIRQYILNIDGEVAAGDALTVLPGTSYDANGSCAYCYPEKTENASANLIQPTVSVTGQLTVAYDSTLVIDTVVEQSNVGKGYLLVSGTLTIAYSSSEEKAGTLTLDGTMRVTGTVIGTYMETDGIGNITHSGNNVALIVDDGSVQITVASGDFDVSTFNVWGTSYTVEATTSNSNDVVYIMNFTDAIAAATEAEIEDVYIYAYGAQNRTTADYAADNGAFVIDTEVTIPSFMTINIVNALVVGENGTLILADGAVVMIDSGEASKEAVLWNNGKVVDYSGAMKSFEGTDLGDTDSGIFMYQVKKITDTDTEYYVVYTTLAIAIDEAKAGETIELNNKVTITEDLTIPADVTVVTDDSIAANEVAFEINGATLTIDGTFELAVDGQKVVVKDNEETNRDGAIVLNNIIANADSSNFTDGDNGTYTVAGAYYIAMLGDDTSSRSYISSVAVAASNSAEIDDTNGITIKGTLSAGTVIFTEGENADLTITIDTGAVVTSGNITLVDADLDIKGTYTGSVKSDVTAGTSSMEFSKVSGVNVAIASEDDGSTITTTMVFSGQTLKGSATVTAGTVYLSGSMTVGTYTKGETGTTADYAILTVGSGSTLVIPKNAALSVASYASTVKDYSGLVVDGTLAINEGELKIAGSENDIDAGQADINGTITVDGKDQNLSGILNVAGDVTVSDDYKITIAKMYVGDSDGASGSIAGTFVTTSFIAAYPSADITSASINEGTEGTTAIITNFYINGELYLTSYAVEEVSIGEIIPAKVEMAGYEAIELGNSNETSDWFSDEEMSTKINSTDKVQNISAAYAKAVLKTVKVQVSVGTNMSVYIDDVRYSNGQTAILTVGEHTVTTQVDPGYVGTTSVLFDGVAVTGGVFNVTAEMANEAPGDGGAGSPTIILSAMGDISTDAGTVSGSSDDGMGLTDILLIVLVVLILVMAIIVALRLMRS